MNRISAPDGTPLEYDAYEPQQPRVAVLFLHDWGKSSHQERAADTGALLKVAGFATYLLDQRGHGRSGGRRGHLSRFSQLLGDLQAFRRAVRRRYDIPQVIWGHGFGGLIALRYLETQPGEAPAAAIVSNPWLGFRRPPAIWKRLAARFADLWPSFPTSGGHAPMTAGARAELQWAQHAIVADQHRIESRLLYLLGAEDEVIDGPLARRFAERLTRQAQLCWYPNLRHDLLGDGEVLRDVTAFLASAQSSDSTPKND
jgi:alpha-beta hydrolase superfamily lysophospholipase